MPPTSTPPARRERNSVTRRVARLGTEKGAQEAVNAISTRLATKSIPVKGFEDVLSNPRSIRSWARAVTRTGITAGLMYVLPGAGNWIEEALNRIGYKRMAIAAAVMTTATFLVVVSVLVSAAAAVEEVLKPVSVVASILDHIPGFGSDDGDEGEAIRAMGKMCGPPPDTAAATLPSDGATPPSGENAPPPSSSFHPEPVIDPVTGKATQRVHDAMQLIPAGSPPLLAESWLMYYLSHPEGDANREWGAFSTAYEGAYAYVNANKPRPTVDENGTRVDVTPLEIVMAIDPNPTYTPFQLVSSAAVYTLGVEKYLPMTQLQSSALKGRIYAACGV